MVEIFSEDRTRNYGRFVHFKAAKDTLDSLREKGEIAGEIPAVLVMCYKNGALQRSYTATHNGRWRVPKEAKAPDAGEKLRAKTARIFKQPRRVRAKVLQMRADRCFQDGQPDWIVKPLPVFR